MTRRVRSEIFGSYDSLLPIVVNVVGILIVAIVLIGQRFKLPDLLDAESEPSAAAQLDARRNSAGMLEDEIHGLNSQAQHIQSLSARRHAQRAAMAVELAAAEKALADHRAALNSETRRQFDLAHDLAQARAELERLEAARTDAKSKPSKTVQIQNYPTPISHLVDGKELHYQLKDGRIAVIPLEDLLNKFKSEAKEKLWRLKDSDEMTDMVGPIGGFHLRYTLERNDVGIQLTKWELVPVKDNLGESVEEALAQNSAFHLSLADLRAAEWTTTLWVYPDSFEVFREARKDLYQRGFPTAGRPLPPTFLIGGSPQGTKSAAQ